MKYPRERVQKMVNTQKKKRHPWRMAFTLSPKAANYKQYA